MRKIRLSILLALIITTCIIFTSIAWGQEEFISARIYFESAMQLNELKRTGIDILAEYESFVVAKIKDLDLKLIQDMGFEVEELKESTLIKVAGVEIDTTGPMPTPPRALELVGPTNHYIIQFVGPIKPEWKKQVELLGGKLFDYIPQNAFLAELVPGVRDKVAKLSFIQWIGVYEPAYKVNPKLAVEVTREGLSRAFGTGEVTLDILVYKPTDVPKVVKKIEDWKGKVLSTGEDKIRAVILRDFIPDISQLPEVKWLEEYIPPRLLNDIAAEILEADTAWNNSSPLTGRGQIVAIADTGLDSGKTDASLNKDFRGRVVSLYALGRPNDASDPHGHGTHVAGSVLGSGEMSGGRFKGMAPSAKLVLQSVLDDRGGLGGLPVDLKILYEQAYRDGARIHSNSWGEPVDGDYTTYAKETDQFVWDNKDMLIVFAAGNEGLDSNRNGVVDLDSLCSPGTAKNCLTVGATETERPANSGGLTGSTWGNVWGSSFPVDPINRDRISSNKVGLAAFSSRGPTDDDRIKPDVVAPGTDIISCRSQLGGTGWGVHNDWYIFMGGTSMSTPLVSGISALVREFYTELEGLSSPSAALLKATLINGAVDLVPGQYGTGASQEIKYRPDNVQGWGRVNLANSLFPSPPQSWVYIDNKEGLSTGGRRTFSYDVMTSNVPLKATLVWTDYPGRTLVNDLDLTIISPNGEKFYGNDFIAPFDTAHDRVNNVEQVLVSFPTRGKYTFEVEAANIPQKIQDFALVISAGFQEGGEPERPNLIISSVFFDPTYPKAGEDVAIAVTVRNVGDEDPKHNSVLVRIFQGDPSAGGSQIDTDKLTSSLSTGEEATLNYIWRTEKIKPGDYEIYTVVDPDNIIAETNEMDNIASRRITLESEEKPKPPPQVNIPAIAIVILVLILLFL